ncbi:MAG: hypothetical protein EHM28_13965 [Spirochaetaceae bacterium]|nr:MAG: hypothetical protein EHM28_13965 [Spirochaetaceae bacterium]
MEQLFFLSIVMNTFAGLVVVASHFGAKYPVFKQLDTMSQNIGIRMIIAVVVLVIAVIKLIIPFNGFPVIGDLLPTLAGISLAAILLFDYYKSRSDEHTQSFQMIDDVLLKNKFIIGIGAIITSLLHFLFPGAIIF